MTCKHRTRKDFLFISRELQALFIEATVDHTFFAGHAVLAARFRRSGDTVPRFIWRMPSHRPCSAMASVTVPSTGWIPPRTSPSDTYLIASVRSLRLAYLPRCTMLVRVRCSLVNEAVPVPVMFGVSAGLFRPAPRARDGEVQPQYFGQNLRHTHWFRQLRRIQAYVQALVRVNSAPSAVEHRAGLWGCYLPCSRVWGYLFSVVDVSRLCFGRGP